MTTKEPSRYQDLGPLHDILLRACPADAQGRRSIMVLAEKMNMSFQNLYKWIDAQRIPARRVKEIVELSEGRVTKEELIDFVI